MFQVGEWSEELIICLLDVLKNDFGDVDEAMVLGVRRPLEIIFCLLRIERFLRSHLSDVLSW
jgi:hypothetical protein